MLQSSCRTLLLSKLSTRRVTCPIKIFQDNQTLLSLPGAVGGRGRRSFQGSCRAVSCVKTTERSHLQTFSPCGAFDYSEPAARYFPWQGFKKLYTSYLAVSAGCQRLSAIAWEHPTFSGLESKPSVMYVKALGQTWCLCSQRKIACGWFSLIQKPLTGFQLECFNRIFLWSNCFIVTSVSNVSTYCQYCIVSTPVIPLTRTGPCLPASCKWV